MSDAQFEIKTLNANQMDIPIGWAQAEGWNPGLDDSHSFFSADPDGFLGGCLGAQTIATISAVSYEKRFGFIGFFIVDPRYRGLGYGKKIWEAALLRLQGAPIGLDGVVAQQEFYRRSGFVLAHRNISYQGHAQSFPDAGRDESGEFDSKSITTYDNLHFGFPRPSFLKAWLAQPHGKLKLVLKEGSVQGYGLIRKCYIGYKIGPLFARDYSLAERILQALISSIPTGESYFLDIPEPNDEAARLCENYRLSPVFETARMYKGQTPDLPLKNIFGITSFELG